MCISVSCAFHADVRRASRYVTSLNLLNDRPSNSRTVYAVFKLVDDCTTICYHGYRGLENDLICMYMIIMIIVMYCWCLLKVHRRLLILSFWRLFLRFKQNTTKNIAFYLWTFLRNLHSKTHQISPFWFQFFNFSFQLRGEHPPQTPPLLAPPSKTPTSRHWNTRHGYGIQDIEIPRKAGKQLKNYQVRS